MGTGKNSTKGGGGCGLFIILSMLTAIGVFTGTWPYMLAVLGVLLIIGLVFLIVYLVDKRKKKKAVMNSPVPQLSPKQYEEYVGQFMLNNGFKNVRLTKASGDFGADVLCEYPDGRTVCIQCKHYSQPVGVKAVQEVIAAKSYYRCDEAWVCASNSYTPAALEMATKTGVKLYTIK